MRKLIPMTDFVLEQSAKINDPEILARTLVQRAKFLKEILNIGMFVPAKFENGEWIVLEEPTDYKKWLEAIDENDFNYFAQGWEKCREYQEAKQRVLFVDFKVLEYNNTIFHVETKNLIIGSGYKNGIYKKIEDLVNHNLILTESGKQQSGL